jgi:putative protease
MELLAPVGSSEALRAAVQNGADAVYFGGKLFNARQNADNFSVDEIREKVRYCHLYGVKVYVTVNILIKNEELPELINYIYSLYECGVDALIVQDIGVAYLIHTLLPEMKLTASTQMTIHNSPGVNLMEKWGFSRTVLAREVSLENIALIGERTSLELETFVHGALCVCYSGQCLMSSLIGGRSGNRGRCAQPCRLPYTLVDEKGENISGGAGQYLLSPRDLNMIEHLPLLAESGVVSLKVEGRMKRPEYVATVIRNYREALDRFYENKETFQVEKDNLKELAQIFNRDFTTGYFMEKPGSHLMSYQRPNNRGTMLGRVVNFNPKTSKVTVRLEAPLVIGDGYVIWVTKGGYVAGEVHDLKIGNTPVERAEKGEINFTINNGRPGAGDRVFKTMDIELMEKARKSFIGPQGIKKSPIEFIIKINEGSSVIIEARDELGNHAVSQGQFIVEKAEKHSLTEEGIERQLTRLGDTIFALDKLEIQMGEGLMVPVSELNNLRRDVVGKLEELRLQAFTKPSIDKDAYQAKAQTLFKSLPCPHAMDKKSKVKISIYVGDMASLTAALEAGADIVYFGGDRLRRKKGVLPGDFPSAVRECHLKGAQAVLVIPRLFHENDVDKVTEYCLKGQEAGVDGFLAGNPSALELAEVKGLHGIICDYTLNIFNDFTGKMLLEKGVKTLSLSPELTLKQIGEFGFRGNAGLELLVHGQIPLMIMEHCTIGNIIGKGHQDRGCNMPCLNKSYGLKDRMNMVFSLESDEHCRMLVFNPKTLNMLEHLDELIQAGVGVLRIEARKEDPYWVSKVVGIYRKEINRIEKGLREKAYKFSPYTESTETLKNLSPAGFTTGHYYRGVE